MSVGAGGLGRRLAANTLHAASGRVVALALWLVLTPKLLTALGAEGFAVWSLFFALTGYLGALDLGFAQATLRHVAAARTRGDDEEAGEFTVLALCGYVTLGLLWMLITPFVRDPILDFLRVSGAVRPGAELAFRMGALVFILAGSSNTLSALFQGYGRFDLANLATIAVAVVQASGFVLAIRTHTGLPGVLWSSAAGYLAGVLVSLALLPIAAPAYRWASPLRARRRLREILRFGMPMQVANVLAIVHQHVDKLLLARFVALASVTPYEIGLRISSSASTFPQLLLLALIPAAAEIFVRDDRERLRELYVRSTRYVLAVTAVLMAVIWGAAIPLLHAWLGRDPGDVVLAVRGLGLASSLALVTGVGTSFIRAVGRTEFEAEFSAVAVATHLAFGLWLIPKHGMLGAVLASILATFIGGAWFMTRFCRLMGWSVRTTLLAVLIQPVLAAFAGGACGGWLLGRGSLLQTWPAWPLAIVVAAACAGVTAVLLLSTRYVSLAEIRSLSRTPGVSA